MSDAKTPEARKLFEQAESALDPEAEALERADVRASRTIRMLGEEYLKDSRPEPLRPGRGRRTA